MAGGDEKRVQSSGVDSLYAEHHQRARQHERRFGPLSTRIDPRDCDHRGDMEDQYEER